MNRLRAILFFSLLLFIGCSISTSDTVCASFTMANFNTLPHPHVAAFSRDSNNIWSGTTSDGKTFTQYPIPNNYGLRIERFVIDDYAHYIVEGKLVYSLQELSVSLAQGRAEPHG